jgi:hypothetical protein
MTKPIDIRYFLLGVGAGAFLVSALRGAPR